LDTVRQEVANQTLATVTPEGNNYIKGVLLYAVANANLT
jgi:hypothetical protein